MLSPEEPRPQASLSSWFLDATWQGLLALSFLPPVLSMLGSVCPPCGVLRAEQSSPFSLCRTLGPRLALGTKKARLLAPSRETSGVQDEDPSSYPWFILLLSLLRVRNRHLQPYPP